MKTIQDIIIEGKSGELKKLYMLTIMIPYQMWKEYKVYDDFFGKLDKDEINKYRSLDATLSDFENNNERYRFSIIKKDFDIINSLADYIINNVESTKSDKLIWKEIKEYVS